MGYSEKKADKLIEVYSDTLIKDKKYNKIDPYGNGKQLYKIYKVFKLDMPSYGKLAIQIREAKQSNDWEVIVVAQRKGDPDIELMLQDVLKMKKIQHLIDKIRL